MFLDLNNLINISKLSLGALNDIIILSNKGKLIYDSGTFYKSKNEQHKSKRLINLLSPLSNYFNSTDSIKALYTSRVNIYFLKKGGFMFIHIVKKSLLKEYGYHFDNKLITEKLNCVADFLLYLAPYSMLLSSDSFLSHIQEQIANFLINLENNPILKLGYIKDIDFLKKEMFSKGVKERIKKTIHNKDIYSLIIFDNQSIIDIIPISYAAKINEINYSISLVKNNRLKRTHALSSFPVHLENKNCGYFSGLCYFFSHIYKIHFIYLTSTAYFDLAVLAEIQKKLVDELTKIRFFSKLNVFKNKQVFFFDGMNLLYTSILDLDTKIIKEYQKEDNKLFLKDEKIRINNILCSLIGKVRGKTKIIKLRNDEINICIYKHKFLIYVIVLEGGKEYKTKDVIEFINTNKKEIFK